MPGPVPRSNEFGPMPARGRRGRPCLHSRHRRPGRCAYQGVVAGHSRRSRWRIFETCPKSGFRRAGSPAPSHPVPLRHLPLRRRSLPRLATRLGLSPAQRQGQLFDYIQRALLQGVIPDEAHRHSDDFLAQLRRRVTRAIDIFATSGCSRLLLLRYTSVRTYADASCERGSLVGRGSGAWLWPKYRRRLGLLR